MNAEIKIMKRIGLEHSPVINSIDYTLEESQKIVTAAGQALTLVDLSGNSFWTHFALGSLNHCRVGTFNEQETIVCGGFDYSITFLDPEGRFRFPRKRVKYPVYALEIFQSDKLFVCAGRTAMLFEPPQRQATWTEILPTVAKCSHTSTDSIYIGDLNNRVKKFTSEGELIWEAQLEASPQSIAVRNPDDPESDLTVGLSNGALVNLSPEGKENWLVIRKRQTISTLIYFQIPDLDEEHLFVTTLEGIVLVLNEEGCPVADLDLKCPVYAARFNTLNPSEYAFFVGTVKGDVLLLKIEPE
ncbi:MAG: hypothetical protein ACFFBD_17350 [Candidatus Hodarchaeota archaeon]